MKLICWGTHPSPGNRSLQKTLSLPSENRFWLSQFAKTRVSCRLPAHFTSTFMNFLTELITWQFKKCKKKKNIFLLSTFFKFIMLQAAICISFRGLNFIPIWVSFRVRVTQKIFTPVWNFKPVRVSFQIRVTCPLLVHWASI